MMRLWTAFAVTLLFPLSLYACWQDPAEPKTKDGASQEEKKDAKPAEKAKPKRDAAKMRDPSKWTEKAPENFTVRFDTTQGEVLIDVTRSWSPNGADRFYNLVKSGYYDDVAFFRVISGFMAQVGINGDPKASAAWRTANIPDDKAAGKSNTRGMVSFAKTGMPNSRSTRIFINFSDNSRLDGMGFTPIGKVRDMAAIDKLYSGYGEGAPSGMGPDQGRIQMEGNEYLKKSFPKLDYIRYAEIVEGEK